MKRYLFRLARAFGAVFLALIGRDRDAKVLNAGASHYFFPSRKMVLECTNQLFIEMRNSGYARADYLPVRKDCNIYSRKGAGLLYDLLLGQTEGIEDALGKELAVFQYSFLRDNGKRHRLILCVDDEKKHWYIENYPVFDRYHDESGMIRYLSAREQKNGVILG